MTYYENQDELQHFGIKGMKWGVRRFEGKNGKLTPAGKKRYADTNQGKKLKGNIKKANSEYRKANVDLKKAYRKSLLSPTKANRKNAEEKQKELNRKEIDYKRSKLDYKTGKEVQRIRDKNIKFENKSKHRLKLEQRYKDLGMNDEQAQAAANNRIRTEKILATTAALTVAAVGGYMLNKKMKERIDGVIKAGESLQRIEMRDTQGKLNDVFYTSKGSHDNKRYEGLLGQIRKGQTGEAYMMKLKANKDIRVASQEKAANVFKDLYLNDKEFAKDVESYVLGIPKNMNKKNSKIMYEQFNRYLVDLNQNGSTAGTKFYDKLKKAGYGAIQDVNDMKYSGYNARNPLIVFDNAAKNITVESFRKIEEDLTRKKSIELAKATVEQTLKEMALPAAALTTVAAVGTYATNDAKKYRYEEQNKFIKNYKKEHPNSKLSDGEIAKLYKKEE